MAGLTLEQAQEKLTQYLDAEEKVLLGQRTQIDNRDLQRADLEAIQKGVTLWDARVKALSRTGGIPVREVIPR